MDPLLRKITPKCDEEANAYPHVTIFGVGVHKNRDYAILHGIDMETQKEYWIKVSNDEIIDAANTIMEAGS